MTLRGIAFDSGYGIREVLVSDDRGATWQRAGLGADRGRYSFREWSAPWTPRAAGTHRLMVRAVNADRRVTVRRAALEPGRATCGT